MTRLPTGTVTFLFTDVEGSTKLLEQLGEQYHHVQDRHASIMRMAVTEGGGFVVSTEGDSFFAVFQTHGALCLQPFRHSASWRQLRGHPVSACGSGWG